MASPDVLIREIERQLVTKGGLLANELQALQRLHRFERSATQLGGLRRALQAANAAGNPMSRIELRALQAQRARALANIGARGLQRRYLLALVRHGVVTRGAALAMGATIGVALLVVVGVGLAIYLTKTESEKESVASSSSSKKQGIASSIDCDCANINAGILNAGFIPECRGHEQKLRELAAAGDLNIDVNDDGVITGGDVCGSPDNGPSAWPVKGAPGTPPETHRPEKDCTWFAGLVRSCGD